MYIYLYKDEKGYIRGFQSHIRFPERWKKDNLRVMPESDYNVLRLFLTGREHVKEVKSSTKATTTIGGIHLKDDGDFVKQHHEKMKEIMIKKDRFKHFLCQKTKQ